MQEAKAELTAKLEEVVGTNNTKAVVKDLDDGAIAKIKGKQPETDEVKAWLENRKRDIARFFLNQHNLLEYDEGPLG